MPEQHFEPQKLAHSAPETQAQAAPLVASLWLAGFDKLVDYAPEADRAVAMLAHGLHDPCGERVSDARNRLSRNLR